MSYKTPIFYIWYKGKPIPLNLRGYITKFDYEDCDDKEDMLTLRFEGIPVALLDHSMFAPGSEITVKWGYADGQLSKPKICVVKEPDYKFDAMVTFDLNAYDKSNHLKGGVVNKVWKKSTLTGVASSIAGKYKLKFVGEDSKEVVKSLTQSGKTDWEFLLDIAKRANFIVYVSSNTLYFKSRDLSQKPSYKASYNESKSSNLISTDLKYQMHRQRGPKIQTTGVGINPFKGTVISHTASVATKADKTSHAYLGTRTLSVDGATGQTKWVQGASSGNSAKIPTESGKIMPMPMPTIGDIKNKAEHMNEEAQIKTIEGTLKLPGDCTWESRKVAEITGVNRKMVGNYYINEVKHSIDSSGYFIEPKVQRNAQGSGGKEPKITAKKNISRSHSGTKTVAKKSIGTTKSQSVHTQPKVLYVDGATGHTVLK
jgi:phage protein D